MILCILSCFLQTIATSGNILSFASGTVQSEITESQPIVAGPASAAIVHAHMYDMYTYAAAVF